MKHILTAVALLVAALYNKVHSQATTKNSLLKYESENNGVGNYRFKYRTSDGASREETGEVVYSYNGAPSYIVKGKFSFVAPEGIKYTVTYTADERGFLPIITQVKIIQASFKRIQPNAVATLQGGGLG